MTLLGVFGVCVCIAMLKGGEKWDLDFSCFMLGGGSTTTGSGWVEGLRGRKG